MPRIFKPPPIRIDERFHFHFVTTSCYDKKPLFHYSKKRDTFLLILDEIRSQYGIKISGYVIMPDHIHLILYDETRSISDMMRMIKSISARELRARGLIQEPKVWRPRFYSFNIGSVEKLKEKLDYCHKNPLNKNLVQSPEEWKHSSFEFYEYGKCKSFRIDPWGKIWPA